MREPITPTVSLTSLSDPLTGILRRGAQQMLATAIEAEVAEWIDQYSHRVDEDGQRQVVRNGHLPARKITTGLGEVEVRQRRTKGNGSRNACLAIVFKLTQAAEKKTSLYVASQDLCRALGRDVPWITRW